MNSLLCPSWLLKSLILSIIIKTSYIFTVFFNLSFINTIDGVFQAMSQTVASQGEELCGRIKAKYQFDMKDTKSSYYLDLLDAPGSCGKLEGEMEPTTRFVMKEKDFVKMFKGKLKCWNT